MLGFCFVGFVCTVSLVSDFVFQILYSSIPVSCLRLRTSVFLFVVADFPFCISWFVVCMSDLRFEVSDIVFPVYSFALCVSLSRLRGLESLVQISSLRFRNVFLFAIANCTFCISRFVFYMSDFRFFLSWFSEFRSILGFRLCISSLQFRIMPFSSPVSEPRVVGSDFRFAISECILICSCKFHILHFAICFWHGRFPILGFRFWISD
jgi:hypothetical protein